MKTVSRILDFGADNLGLDAPELPKCLICIERALLLAGVPGIRCTNDLQGMQSFQTAGGTPAHLLSMDITNRARRGESVPSPREVLAMFGMSCHGRQPCGAPVTHDCDSNCPHA